MDSETKIGVDAKVERRLNKQLGFVSYSAFFSFVILELGRESLGPPPMAEVALRDTIPAFITGESGSGETTAAKALLKD